MVTALLQYYFIDLFVQRKWVHHDSPIPLPVYDFTYSMPYLKGMATLVSAIIIVSWAVMQLHLLSGTFTLYCSVH